VLRLVAFFAATLLLLGILRSLLGGVPVIGALLGIPFVGFWLVAILLALVLSKLAAHALDRRQHQALVRQLSAVETPHNQGKLGSLFANQGRHRRAIPLLEEAARGEPATAEWGYRLGCSYLSAGRLEEAVRELERVLALDEEHAYGSAALRLAEARARAGEHAEALEVLALFERNHGPSPESAYRRGKSLAALSRREEARAAFDEVGELVGQAAEYQKKSGALWAWRARWARIG